jgi:hypothetical protein
LAKLREIFRRNVSQPVGTVIERINPILRGWVNYFRIGDSSRCFSVVKQWVEKKVRRHMVGIYPVDLSRLRDVANLRTYPEFSALYARIWADLRHEVLKNDEQRAISIG